MHWHDQQQQLSGSELHLRRDRVLSAIRIADRIRAVDRRSVLLSNDQALSRRRKLGQQRLSGFARAVIAHAPTPLERLEGLSARLEGPSIWMKRDDCTGLAGGGNKVRKLEFIIGAALKSQAGTLITAGGIQSNHARQTAAAAARFNMRCILVLTDSVPGRSLEYRNNGNLLIDRLLGAEIHFVGGDIDSGPLMEAIAERERVKGNRPYIIPVGGSNAVGALGYVAGFFEMLKQFHEHGITSDGIVLPTSSGGTQAGLVLGALLSEWRSPILGICVGASADRQREKVEQALRSAATLLNMDHATLDEHPLLIDDRFIGPGYGQPTPETIHAIRLTAETEGILLDPAYTGKGMAALIALIRDGRFRRDQNIVFLHTGGSPALAAYPEYFQQ
jgi:D-cysteine desulfhydrase family pyridoxal phosphate-dependent enzyme